ncbi:hypothetical protein FOA52_012418 [Chlamydomonas sp. UWO 241]|nr:hypothetical protein FOA52_012418 [Chlamydomonas sp. UWO 241]
MAPAHLGGRLAACKHASLDGGADDLPPCLAQSEGGGVVVGGGSSSLVIKPANDQWKYRSLLLPNGMRCMLVSDPEADKAAASVDVNVGSLSDPEDFPGLAHFCEHMLFYASEKYPEEDAYSKFVSDHGGSVNAWTASENTNYQFDVNWDSLDETLDRFSQFFIAPHISADGVEREVNAVDSEHGKNLASDPWRQMQLYKHTANQAHPWARFATGSRQTLLDGPRERGLDPRAAVDDFHSREYSANLMGLVVYGRHTLDEMEAMVRPRFSPVLNKQLAPLEVPSDVFLDEHRGTLLKVVPVKDGHSLELAWQTPPAWKHYKSCPLSFLSHLLGHEGAGSVFSVLKAKGWVLSLVAGESGLSMSSASFFYVKAELTDDGHAHAADVGALIFRYIEVIVRKESEWKLHHDEVCNLSRLNFDNRDKPRPYSYVTSLAGALQLYPEEDVLLACYHVPQEFKPALISEALACMSLSSVRACWTSKLHAEDATETEPTYGTKYHLGRLPEDWVAAWRGVDGVDGVDGVEDLHLPRPNPYIPTDFALLKDEAWEGVPRLVVDEPRSLTLYHKCDLTFSTPKAIVMLDFQTPDAYSSPECAVMTRLFASLVEDGLNELAYDASLAGLAYSVTEHRTGFTVAVNGYNHKLLVLLEEVLKRVVHFTAKPDRLAVIKEQTMKAYRNMRFQQPYQWAMYRQELLLNLSRWRVEEYLEVAPGIGAEQLTEFVSKRLLSKVHVVGLCVGNIPQTEVDAMAGQLNSLLRAGPPGLSARPLFATEARDTRVLAMPDAAECPGGVLFVERGPNPSDENSAVVVTYQVGPDELRRNALHQLLVQLLKRDAFNTLRTQQQLGYIVSMFSKFEHRVQLTQFVIQSNAFGASTLAHRVDAFVGDCLSRVLRERVRKGGLVKAVEELSKTKLERPKTLRELAGRYWSEVFHGTLVFDRQQQEVDHLRSLTRRDLMGFARSVLSDGKGGRRWFWPFTRADASGGRRKLVVAVVGSAETSRGKAVVVEASEAAVVELGAAVVALEAAVEEVAAAVEEVEDLATEFCGPAGKPRAVSDVAHFRRTCGTFHNAGPLQASA